MNCSICNAGMNRGLEHWHFVCKSCSFEASNLKPEINIDETHARIDEASRFDALTALRIENFAHILTRLKKHLPPPATILDVGCAYGWFLQSAKDAEYEPYGIEPENQIASDADKKHGHVRSGFFPDILASEEKFNAIIFNDVFEHLPDIRASARSIYDHLNSGGIAIINGPNRNGFFYRVSRALRMAGWKMPFFRMWQHGFASPHISYFTPDDLAALYQQAGFEEIDRFPVASLRIKGLWSRLSYDTRQPLIVRIMVWCASVCAMPIITMFPSDNYVQFFMKK